MIPSARTPTTSKRVTTALRRKRRAGRRMTLAKPIRTAPKKAEQADQGRAHLGDPFAELGQHAEEAGPLLGADPRRLVELADLLEQADLVAAGADDLGAAVADGAVDDPRADRVHALDFGQVDGQRIGQRIDFALGRRRARDRQRAGDPVDRAVPLVLLVPLCLVVIGHARRIDARNAREGQVASADSALPCPVRRLYAPPHERRHARCCLCRLERTRRGRSGWMRATGRAAWRPTPGSIAREAPEPGRAALLASMGYAWDPAWLKAMRARPAHGADARRQAGDGACAGGRGCGRGRRGARARQRRRRL